MYHEVDKSRSHGMTLKMRSFKTELAKIGLNTRFAWKKENLHVVIATTQFWRDSFWLKLLSKACDTNLETIYITLPQDYFFGALYVVY